MTDQPATTSKAMISKRHLLFTTVSWLTLLLSLATLVVTFVWLITGNGNLEPLCTLLGVSAVICGLIFDPLIQKRDLRRDIIEAIKIEISCNCEIIKNSCQSWDEALAQGSVVYGRFACSAVERALDSGVFTRNDGDLYLKMLETRADLHATNAAMTIVEILMIFKPDLEQRKDLHNRVAIGGNLVRSKTHLIALQQAIEVASF